MRPACSALLLLVGSACATALKPSKQSWANIASELDFDCFKNHRCQQYDLGLRGGRPIKVRLKAGAAATVVIKSEWMEEVVEASASATASAEATFVMRGQADDFRQASILVVTEKNQPPVEYELEVEPAPSSVYQAPSPREDRLAKLEGRRQDREAVRARADQQDQKRSQAQTRVQEAAAARAAKCRSGNVVFERLLTRSGSETFRFCDDTTVVRDPTGHWGLTQSLSGPEYERLTSQASANLEVASHNARVLNTSQARQVEANARASFEAKVALFVSKHRWPKERYIAEAKRCTIPAREE